MRFMTRERPAPKETPSGLRLGDSPPGATLVAHPFGPSLGRTYGDAPGVNNTTYPILYEASDISEFLKMEDPRQPDAQIAYLGRSTSATKAGSVAARTSRTVGS